MSVPQPILVYSTYALDLPRFAQLLKEGLPGVEINFASTVTEAEPYLLDTQVLYGWGFSTELLRRMPALRWVQKIGAGVDDIVETWPFDREVVLTRTDGRLIATRMVEYVLGALLDKTIRFDHARRQQAAKHWQYFEIGSISDLTIGVAGVGEIGLEVARSLKNFGARVIGWRRSKRDTPYVDNLYSGAAELKTFAQDCDAIILVLPLTNETKQLFDRRLFDYFKTGTHIINVGRGGVIAELDLLAAIDQGKVGHATLDVFKTEPLSEDHPFWHNSKITITPHVCGPLIPENVVPHFIKNFRSFSTGCPLQNVVDLTRQY